ncbi:MAG TPA: CapA family protein [Actinopolymorphaceae bacterium]|nr:CapA family protein [Actinopolymorphaceae bacterium]
MPAKPEITGLTSARSARQLSPRAAVDAVPTARPASPATTAPKATPASTPTASTTPTTTTTPTAATTPSAATAQPLTIAFAGDIQFEGQLRHLLDDPATVLAPIRSRLAAADLTIANLETAVTTRGRPEDKAYTFRAAPTALDALAAAGVDVVTMANNHGVDFGPQGLADTLAAVDNAPLAVVGIGRDAAQAFAPHVATIRGTSVAVLGATAFDDPTARHYPAGANRAGVAVALDPERLIAAVREARRTNDVVIVYLHWGIERVPCPTRDQRSLAHRLARAGADIVIGSHAHVLLGTGRLGRTYVGYGLGNFVWRNRNSVPEITTGVLTLTLNGRAVTASTWAPAIVGADGLPHFTTGDTAERMRRAFAKLRSCTDLAPLADAPS